MSFGTRISGFGGFPARGDYEIEQSLMFDKSTNSYLHRTPSSAGNRRTWTWSGWIKIGGDVLANGSILFSSHDNSNENDATWASIGVYDVADNLGLWFNAWTTNWRVTTATMRDPAAWYHIVVALDTTQSTAADRVKMYINGVEQTSADFSTNNNPSQNADLGINNTTQHRVSGANYSANPYAWGGYMAEVHFIDGTALTANSFGKTDATTGQWIPKKVTGLTYGTNGFYFKFVSGAVGTDSSGEGNNYTTQDIDNDDVCLDSPTNNFATVNPLSASTDIDWYQGNLVPYQPTQSNFGVSVSTIAVESGKYYAEFRLRGTDSNAQYIGAGTYVPVVSNTNQNGNGSGNVVLFPQHSTAANRAIVVNGTAVTTSIAAGSQGDKYGVALDADNAKVYFYRNGSAIGSTDGYDITDVGTGKYHFIIGVRGSSGYIGYWEANFGQNSSFAGNETKQNNGGEGEDFFYTPPTDYKALCTANLPDPTIKKSTEHYNTVTYTGDGSTNAITGVGFQPDFSWFKSRSDAYEYSLVDSVRGVNKALASNSTSIESSFGTNYTIDSFDSDGFTLHDATYNNANTKTYVAWNWLAGTAFSNDASATGIGSIDSSGEVNADAGFSIVSFTMPSSGQATVKHGLSVKPNVLITKDRESTYNWAVFHDGFADTTSKFLRLNTNDDIQEYSTVWGAALPTSSVFGVTAGGLATASNDVIAYCFHDVENYSKFGTFVGNASSDGPFIFTGFRPAWVLLMLATTDGSSAYWNITDTKRGYNGAINTLPPNDGTRTDGSGNYIDHVSNGFKIRASNYYNSSGYTYIYFAFAEFPFKYSNAR